MSDDRLVFTCVCGCVTGMLFEDRSLECASCGLIYDSSEDFKWTSIDITQPIEIERKDRFKIVAMNSTEAAYNRALHVLQSRKKEVVGFAVLYANGTHSTWFDLEEDQVSWVQEHLDEVKEYVNANFKDQSAFRQGGAEDSGSLPDSDQGS